MSSKIMTAAFETEMMTAVEILFQEIVSDQPILTNILNLGDIQYFHKQQQKLKFKNEQCKQQYFSIKRCDRSSTKAPTYFQNNVKVKMQHLTLNQLVLTWMFQIIQKIKTAVKAIHVKKERPQLSVIRFCQVSESTKCQNKKNKNSNIPWFNHC